MNLRDRLDKIKENNLISIKDETSNFNNINILNIFVNSNSTKELLLSLINNKKNIIFIGDKSIDKMIVASYFQTIIEKNCVIHNNIENNISSLNNQINIIPNISTKQLVKILELIIYGYESFVIGIDMKSTEKIIEKLQAVIALNFQNLTEKNINTLLTSSDFHFVTISKDEDGLFFFSKVEALKCINGEITLTTILGKEKELITVASTQETIEQEPIVEVLENKTDELLDNINNIDDGEKTENITIYEEEALTETETVDKSTVNSDINENKSEDKIKINKYKLLKEKLKNKRNGG